MAESKTNIASEPGNWFFRAVWWVGLAIIALAILPKLVNGTHRIGSSAPAQRVIARTGQSDYTVTNVVSINSYELTPIDLTGDKNFGWSVIENDFPLKIVLNGVVYHQPRKDDPSWKSRLLNGIPTRTLALQIDDSGISYPRHISCEHTRSR
jgi:hypothetical protein